MFGSMVIPAKPESARKPGRGVKRHGKSLPIVEPVSRPNSFIQRKPVCSCGGTCPKCRHDFGIQPKLKIGAPNDKYEQEADRVADQVMRMPEPKVQRQSLEEEDDQIQAKSPDTPVTSLIQRQPEEEEEEELQTKSLIQRQESENEEEELLQTKSGHGKTPRHSTDIVSQIQDLKSSRRQALDPLTRAFMESRLGKDFSQVRIHTGNRAAETAKAINAKAFTLGRDIVFGSGQYQPNNVEGKRLLAHELVHVGQQGNAFATSRGNQAVRKNTVPGYQSRLRDVAQCQAKPKKDAEFPHFQDLKFRLIQDVGDNLENYGYHFFRIAALQPGNNPLLEKALARYALGKNVLETTFKFAGLSDKNASRLALGTGVLLKGLTFVKDKKLILDYQVDLGRSWKLDLGFELSKDPQKKTSEWQHHVNVGIVRRF